jgi:hypothetical protein
MVQIRSKKRLNHKSIQLGNDWNSLYIAGEWMNSGTDGNL